MAESGTRSVDDGGISDVLAEAHKRNLRSGDKKKPKDFYNGDHAEGDHHSVNGDDNKSVSHEDENGTDFYEEERQQNDVQSYSRRRKSDVNDESHTQIPQQQDSFSGEVDLTDPDSVIHMLETVNLTEEDTEDLLQEAYQMNRKLKEMLRRQEESSKPKLKSKSRSNTESYAGNGQKNHVNSATPSSNNSRTSSSVGIRKFLPPINAGETREANVYAIKLRRSKTNVQETKPASSDSMLLRSKSSKPSRKDSGSPTRRRKPSGPKPEWNDRFNYT